MNIAARARTVVPGPHLLRGLAILLNGLWTSMRNALHVGRREPSRSSRSADDCCLELTNIYRRPDPLLYSQYYLMGLGLAVTWDNPDIDVFEFDPADADHRGALVATGALEPNTRYWVRVQVWNGSSDAPAAGLPVALSYLDFGAGITSNPIGTQQISLGVKGSPHSPAHAWFLWTTPEGGGHYCIQALLIWPDDANPWNNLGQKNIQVATAHSPATFRFEVRNTASQRRWIEFEPDVYVLPTQRPCSDLPARRRPESLRDRSIRQLDEARSHNRREDWPVPQSWALTMTPDRPLLSPGESATIQVDVEPRWHDGQRSAVLNVNVFGVLEDARNHLGGVTLRIVNGQVA